MTIQLTIIGLGQIGASLGLALKEHKELVRRIGHDRDAGVARQAEKLGAVDQVVFNIPSAVRQADLVVLDCPVDDVHDILKVIGDELKEGAVVIETGPVKGQVFAWAAETIRPGRDFIAWMPAFNPNYLHEAALGLASVHADLFQNGMIYIATPPNTSSPGVKLAADLANLVGAKAMFADVVEMDGLSATYHMLPQLMAVALLSATVNQPGWPEGRKLAGRTYTEATASIEMLDELESFGQAMLLNRENVVRGLDNLMVNLRDLRDMIADDKSDALESTLTRALVARREWQNDRQKGTWVYEGVQSPGSQLPSSGEIFGRLIGFGKKSGQKDRK